MKKTPLGLRLAAIALGVVVFLWFPVEDTTENWAVLLAAAICAWFAVRFGLRLHPGASYFLLRCLALGAAAGIIVTPATLLLMAVKTGWHAHGTPDFSPAQMTAVIQRTPIWAAGGGLLGLGGGLGARILRK